MSSQAPTLPVNPRSRLRLAIAAAILAFYALPGFLLVPWMAKRELPRIIEDRIHHRASIGELRFNPFTLTMSAGEPTADAEAKQGKLQWSLSMH